MIKTQFKHDRIHQAVAHFFGPGAYWDAEPVEDPLTDSAAYYVIVNNNDAGGFVARGHDLYLYRMDGNK